MLWIPYWKSLTIGTPICTLWVDFQQAPKTPQFQVWRQQNKQQSLLVYLKTLITKMFYFQNNKWPQTKILHVIETLRPSRDLSDPMKDLGSHA